jgi:hypothetical protein
MKNFSRLTSVYIAILLFTLAFSGTASAASMKVVPPAVGAYHGAYADFGATEDEVTELKIQSFDSLAKKKLAWAYSSNHWLNGVIAFPKASVEACRLHGTVPYLRLQPWSEMEQYRADPIFSMQAFIDGKFDAPLRQWARDARDSNSPIMIEFGPEVNGYWFPWNGKWNGGAKRDGYGDPLIPDGPERFRDAYRHLIDLFRAEGANNITWVLHVDAQWDPEEEWNQVKYYYPGDNYIDWIGVSVFGAQLPTHNWIEFAPLLKGFLKQVDEATTTKPILISEYGVIEKPSSPGLKAKWIKDALTSIESGQFPRVRGVTYWNSAGWLENGAASFLINTSLSSLQAYQTAIASPFWLEKAQIENLP